MQKFTRIFLYKKNDNSSSTKNTKTKEWTPPDGKNQFIDSFVHRARTYYDFFLLSISHDARSNLQTNHQTALKDLSSNNNIVKMETDKGVVITIINKDDYITDCITLLEGSSTYHMTITDMTETHLDEADNLLCGITIANEQLDSQLLPTQHKPGIFNAIRKLHRH